MERIGRSLGPCLRVFFLLSRLLRMLSVVSTSATATSTTTRIHAMGHELQRRHTRSQTVHWICWSLCLRHRLVNLLCRQWGWPTILAPTLTSACRPTRSSRMRKSSPSQQSDWRTHLALLFHLSLSLTVIVTTRLTLVLHYIHRFSVSHTQTCASRPASGRGGRIDSARSSPLRRPGRRPEHGAPTVYPIIDDEEIIIAGEQVLVDAMQAALMRSGAEAVARRDKAGILENDDG